jgi:DNA modification methylase
VVLFPSGGFPIEPWLYANHPPKWRLCWYKGSPGILSPVGFADWEAIMVYGSNVYGPAHDHFHACPPPADNGHPCPKPVAWAEWLVTRFTKPDDTVLDPFLGSGTTAVACVQTGRRYIGIELSEAYCEIAAKRIEKALAQPRLPLEAPREKAAQGVLL